MAWEKRGNKRYYYRKKRIGKRVASVYFGNGQISEIIAQMDEQERVEAEAERRRFNNMKQAQRHLEQQIDEVGDFVRAMTRASLLVAGYHTHKGQWRKMRGKKDE